MSTLLQSVEQPARAAALPAQEAEIAYVLKAFPRTSETFIANEIYLLETLGLKLALFSVKRLTDQKLHGNLSRIQSPVTYLPETEPVNEKPFVRWMIETVPRFASAHWRLVRRRPLLYLAALGEALAMCLRYRASFFSAPKKVFFKEFLQAGYIALAILQSGRIRHLHAHFCHGATTIAMFIGRLTGLPFSFTAHAKDIYLKDLNPGNLLDIKMRRAKFVVTCTGANRCHLERIRPKGTPVYTIYHGLDTSLFTPSLSPTRTENTPLILSVGRFVEKKGFTYLVEACKLLSDRGYRFRCQIVGGVDEHIEAVKTRIAELKLGHTVLLRHAVTQEELKRIYQQATVLALPCLIVGNGDRDGIPNVLVEAMAMQIPVVSTDISGIPELVEHGVNGLLVPEKNAEAMAGAIARLLDDSALRQRLGLAARSKVQRLFDAKHNTVALKELFLECLETTS